MSRFRVGALAAALAAAALLPACDSGKNTVHVMAADALALSFQEVKRAFEAKHPDIEVRLDIMGSVMASRLAVLRRSDVLAVADHRLIEKILSPRHADWVAKFASTEIVLASHRSSQRRAAIAADNWFDILLEPDIRFGYANPSQDPCGYYTRMAWELAQKHYFASRGSDRPLARQLDQKCTPQYIALDANELISAYLNMARVDYAFVYRAHAIDQKLPHLLLPKEVNLGDITLDDHYATAQINVPDYKGGTESLRGAVIAFGITILRDARNPEAAREFVRFVLSQEGQDILRRSAFNPIQPARIPKWCAVPDFLADVAKAEN
jgi:molybdate/tungstate transport system substrate-binding protein